MKKYELTDKTKVIADVTLHRIRALIDIPEHNVKAGDLGGWIEAERNLSQKGAAWVADSARVMGSAWVMDSARVTDTALVMGSGVGDGFGACDGRGVGDGFGTRDGKGVGDEFC